MCFFQRLNFRENCWVYARVNWCLLCHYFSPHIVICEKNYSFSRVVFLFYQCIFADYFYFQINGLGSAVKTKISQAVAHGSNLCWAI